MTFGVTIDNLTSLRTVVDDVRADLPPAAEGDQAKITGLPLVFLKAEDLVAADRYRANLLGIGAAGLVLLIGLRRRLDAVRGVVSALLATGTGFALVAITGGGLNPITGALGALTAAVGCEFTVMLSESVRGRPLLRRAVLLVAATSTAGYLVLLASGLEAVRSFGLFLAFGVGLALLSSWAVVTATVRPPRQQDTDDDRRIPAETGRAQEVLV
jgi:predicted RND superfamily exporter protein